MLKRTYFFMNTQRLSYNHALFSDCNLCFFSKNVCCIMLIYRGDETRITGNSPLFYTLDNKHLFTTSAFVSVMIGEQYKKRRSFLDYQDRTFMTFNIYKYNYPLKDKEFNDLGIRTTWSLQWSRQ